MILKKLPTTQVGIYAISEADDREINQLVAWLEEHCPFEYHLDNTHLTITNTAEMLFALRWAYNVPAN